VRRTGPGAAARGHDAGFANLKFDFLDITGMIEATPRSSNTRWSTRSARALELRPITLLGDAAHPMYPRGSNGAGQSSSMPDS